MASRVLCTRWLGLAYLAGYLWLKLGTKGSGLRAAAWRCTTPPVTHGSSQGQRVRTCRIYSGQNLSLCFDLVRGAAPCQCFGNPPITFTIKKAVFPKPNFGICICRYFGNPPVTTAIKDSPFSKNGLLLLTRRSKKSPEHWYWHSFWKNWYYFLHFLYANFQNPISKITSIVFWKKVLFFQFLCVLISKTWCPKFRLW